MRAIRSIRCTAAICTALVGTAGCQAMVPGVNREKTNVSVMRDQMALVQGDCEALMLGQVLDRSRAASRGEAIAYFVTLSPVGTIAAIATILLEEGESGEYGFEVREGDAPIFDRQVLTALDAVDPSFDRAEYETLDVEDKLVTLRSVCLEET